MASISCSAHVKKDDEPRGHGEEQHVRQLCRIITGQVGGFGGNVIIARLQLADCKQSRRSELSICDKMQLIAISSSGGLNRQQYSASPSHVKIRRSIVRLEFLTKELSVLGIVDGDS